MKTMMIVLLAALVGCSASEKEIEAAECESMRRGIIELQVLLHHPELKDHQLEAVDAIVLLGQAREVYELICRETGPLPSLEVPVHFTI